MNDNNWGPEIVLLPAGDSTSAFEKMPFGFTGGEHQPPDIKGAPFQV
jgi:hypothetical protein